MSAKKLCAQLITRALKNLTEEEEEIVVDYLEDSGISVDLDTNPKELCLLLLEKTMQKEMGRPVPLTAYANKLLGENKKPALKDMSAIRKSAELTLGNKRRELPGCQLSPVKLDQNLYTLTTDSELGIMQLSSGQSQYTATVSLPLSLYEKVFSAERNPVLEITTNKGNRGYARIGEPHTDSSSKIFISPLVAMALDANENSEAFLKLCSSLPTIDHIEFTFYGTKEVLDKVLEKLINTLPEVIEAFSYLNLGMVLNTQIDGKKVEVRVDGLTSDTEETIFAGLLPFGVSNITFDVTADEE